MTDHSTDTPQSSLANYGGGEPDRSPAVMPPDPPRILKKTPIRIPLPQRGGDRRIVGWTGPMSTRNGTIGFVKIPAKRSVHYVRKMDAWAVSDSALDKARHRGARIVLIPVVDKRLTLEFELAAFTEPVPPEIRGKRRHKLDPQHAAPADTAIRWPDHIRPTHLYDSQEVFE